MVEHPEFVKLMEMLRPDYKPPSRVDVADTFLPQVYESEMGQCSDKLSGKMVSLALDGWSNVHNEPIVCCTVTTDTGEVYLADTVDTSGKPHTAEYLTEVAKAAIEKAETQFTCTVGSLVTDNAANVNAMRNKITQSSNVVTYGCSAHILNLLAQDLEVPNVKEQVKHVVKYFRNNHFASAQYRQRGCTKLVMPQDVRWNTMCDCLEAYISNWSVLLAVCEENRKEIDSIVHSKVTNLGLKRQAEELYERLSPIAIALDKMQADSAMIADCVEIWKELEMKLKDLKNREINQKFRARCSQAVTPAHLLANLLHPTLQGKNLSPEEKEKSVEYAGQKWPSMMPTIIRFQGQTSPFQPCKFADEVTKSVKPIAWWQSHAGMIPDDDLRAVKQLLSAVAASSGVERVFSSYGLVQSKLRNRLGTEKAAKLVFLFKALNMK